MRLLLIEDDTARRLTMARQLEADGYWLDQARDGEKGLFLAREYPVVKEFSQFQLELKQLLERARPAILVSDCFEDTCVWTLTSMKVAHSQRQPAKLSESWNKKGNVLPSTAIVAPKPPALNRGSSIQPH